MTNLFVKINDDLSAHSTGAVAKAASKLGRVVKNHYYSLGMAAILTGADYSLTQATIAIEERAALQYAQQQRELAIPGSKADKGIAQEIERLNHSANLAHLKAFNGIGLGLLTAGSLVKGFSESAKRRTDRSSAPNTNTRY